MLVKCAHCGNVKKASKLTVNGLHSLIASAVCQKAQKTYDEWEQDEEGFDEELGEGGLCDYIADEICTVIHSKTDLECTTVYNEYDTHTSVYAWNVETKQLFHVDIPPDVYESGFGYRWKKKADVQFDPSDVDIEDVSRNWNDFIDADDEFQNF